MEQTTIIPPSTYLPMVVEAEQTTTNIGETIIDAEIITEDTRSHLSNQTPPALRSRNWNENVLYRVLKTHP